MNKEIMIAHEADPDDPEDRAASVAGMERGLMGGGFSGCAIGWG